MLDPHYCTVFPTFAAQSSKTWAKGTEISCYGKNFGLQALFEDQGARNFGAGCVAKQQVFPHCTPTQTRLTRATNPHEGHMGIIFSSNGARNLMMLMLFSHHTTIPSKNNLDA